MEPLYTTSATSTGGRFRGRVRAARGNFDLEVNPPGQGEGTNPEELFAAGYAACFASAFLLGAKRVLAIDTVPERLGLAHEAGAETIDFMDEDVYDAIMELTARRKVVEKD